VCKYGRERVQKCKVRNKVAIYVAGEVDWRYIIRGPQAPIMTWELILRAMEIIRKFCEFKRYNFCH
jgi:hypothetical protein